MKSTRESIDIKSFETAEETRPFDKGKVELITVAGRTIGRATFEPGWKWSECVGPVAKTRSCQSPHYGIQLTGTMHIVSPEGEYDIRAGDVFNLPPDHDGWVVGDEAVVVIDFQGMADYARPKGEARRERPGRRH
jgi:hypothetical protein